VSQYDPYQSAPPPGHSPEQQPAYGHPGYQPPKTNTMAILGLVFAFVFSPLGVVFSAIGLKQIKERREGGRGLALAGLIISIISIVLGILLIVLFATVLAPAVEKAAQSESAASTSSAAATGAGAPADAHGVVAACKVIVPAVVNLGSDLSTVETPEDYASVMGSLRTTIEAAAGQTTDQAFITHVQALSDDFQKATAAVSAGQDPSSLEGVLNADGTQIDKDCSAAGYVH
jgi:hypothetical protein